MGKITQKPTDGTVGRVRSSQDDISPATAPKIDSTQEPNQDLGLQKNAPFESSANSLEFSPLFVRSHEIKISAKKEIRAIQDLLMGVNSADSKAIEKILQKAGFTQAGSHYKKGASQIRIRPTQLGNNLGHIIEYKQGKKEFKVVAFSQSVVTKSQWDKIRKRFDKVVKQFEASKSIDPDAPLPTDLNALKKFLDKGLSQSEKQKDDSKAKELDARLNRLAARIENLKEQEIAPKGVVVYVAGPDAAGKSSTGAIVIKALETAGFTCRRESFKAPTAEERNQHWLSRFNRGVPAENQAVFWDRGPAGDSVYGDISKLQTAIMGREINEFEAKLRNDNILVMKIELFASLDKQADTFGKRLGRQFIAENIRTELQKTGQMTPEAEEGLRQIMTKVDDDDFRALANFEDIQASFLEFTEASSDTSPWAIVDATKRHTARLKIIDKFSETLEKFVDERSEA